MALPLVIYVAHAAFANPCDVALTRQLSAHSCAGNYGCFPNNTMYVNAGCRGIFTCNGVGNVVCDPCDPSSKCPDGPSRTTMCNCVSAPAPPPAPDGVKYLLLDDRNVITTTATLVLGEVRKNPVGALIKEERDYEMRFDNMQPNVWFDPWLKKWRAWYSAFTSCSAPKTAVPYCNNAPQQCGSVTDTAKNHAGRGSGLLYAESDDGITWTKPNLNKTMWKGSTANNLLELDGMTTGIYLDYETTNSSERYKIVTGSNGNGGICISSDGINWGPVKNLEGDTHARWDTPKNLAWDPDREQWIIYLRAQPTENSLRVQSYSHSLSPHFMGDWSPATPTGLNSSADYQPDGLVVWPYAGIYLGIGNIFNPTQNVAVEGAAIGQVNGVLGWSADGRRWKWIRPHDSFIPLGNAGDFDSCGVFGAKQDPLRTVVNGTLRVYYAGCNGPFFGSRGCALGVAEIQQDGWAGYQGGTLSTAPFRVSTTSLKVSVDGGTTGIRVGIAGHPTYTIENCDPIVGKQTDYLVTWKGQSDIKELNGAFSLEFDIPKDATAFAVTV